MKWDLANLMKQALDKNKKIIKNASENIRKTAEPKIELSALMVDYLEEAADMKKELEELTLKKKCILAKITKSVVNDTMDKRSDGFTYSTLLLMAYHKESEFKSHEHYNYLMKHIDAGAEPAYSTFIDSFRDYKEARNSDPVNKELLENSIMDMARFRRQYVKFENQLSGTTLSETGDMSSFDYIYDQLK